MVCMTLYPNVRNTKKSYLIIKIMLVISVIIALVCIIVNLCTSTKYLWSLIVIAGIVYSWVTVIYAVQRNINIASNVMIQSIAVSVLVLCIDFILGYTGWAINLAIPIIICIANITTLVLTIVSINRYYKYAIYQLIIFLLSLIPMVIYISSKGIIVKPIFTIISSSIALLAFIMSLALCGKSTVEELERRLHR